MIGLPSLGPVIVPLFHKHLIDLYIRKALGYVRRGARVAKRLHVTLRRTTSDVGSEELAETMILSRNGGRLVCRARFTIGEELLLNWPEKHREAHARVVFR